MHALRNHANRARVHGTSQATRRSACSKNRYPARDTLFPRPGAIGLHRLFFRMVIMSQPRSVRSSQSIGWPFPQVAAVLRNEASYLLHRATTSAAAHQAAMAASLRVEIVSLEIGVNVRLHVRRVREARTESGHLTELSVEITWEAIRAPRFFPCRLADLSVHPLSWGETQLDIDGVYWTPMGPLGTVIDSVLGHRVAEASVHRFLQDVAAELQTELGTYARQHQAELALGTTPARCTSGPFVCVVCDDGGPDEASEIRPSTAHTSAS